MLSYANMDINNLKHQCESLKPGTEYVIKITQNKLDEQLKKAISGAGCNVKLEKKNWKTVVVIVKKQKESDEDLLAGLDDLWTWPVKEPDWLKQKEKQMKQKEKQMKQKEKIEYLSKLSLDFNKKIVYLLKNYKKLNRKEIIDELDKSDKIISKYSVIWDEKERKNILEWLNVLKTIYRWDKEIKSKLEKIIKKVKESKLNSKIAS